MKSGFKRWPGTRKVGFLPFLSKIGVCYHTRKRHLFAPLLIASTCDQSIALLLPRWEHMAWQMHRERSALVLRFFENCGYISHSFLRLENCNSISENFWFSENFCGYTSLRTTLRTIRCPLPFLIDTQHCFQGCCFCRCCCYYYRKLIGIPIWCVVVSFISICYHLRVLLVIVGCPAMAYFRKHLHKAYYLHTPILEAAAAGSYHRSISCKSLLSPELMLICRY